MLKDSGFFEKVYRVTCQVPYGRVTSYGAIARYLGTVRSARMVGWALNQSHSAGGVIPAHRVVNRNGVLTGKHHFNGPRVMQQLLESEGLVIENNQIINFTERFWEPLRELPPWSAG